MRIALLYQVAPRKLGSGEALVVAIAREAVWRGHRVDFHCRAPIHPKFAEALRGLGARIALLDELEAHPIRAVRELSRYDVIQLSFLGPRSRIAALAYAAYPARTMFLARSQHPEPQGEPWIRRARRKAFDRVTLLRVASLGAVSEAVRESERRRYHFAAERTRTIYNGVDLDRFHPPEHERKSSPRVVCVAYLQPFKGIHHVINAFSRIHRRDATLRIVGDGPEEGHLRDLARRLQLGDRVEFLSLRDDVPEQLREAQVFVHASYREAFGYAVAEAMACERAVIASPVGGVPEIVEHGVSGLLVRPGDEAGLSTTLDRLLEDEALRARLGENARARVHTHFELRAAAVRHVDWFEEVSAWKRHRTSQPVPVPPMSSRPVAIPVDEPRSNVADAGGPAKPPRSEAAAPPRGAPCAKSS